MAKEEEKHAGGRPLKFKSVEELQKKIDAYFDMCDKANEEKIVEPYTITGLALALDTNRQTLVNYEEKGDEFFDTIKKAKLRVENYAEKYLYGNNVTGVIFSLKNNYGWKDKTETDITTDGQPLTIATVRFDNDNKGS